MTLWKSGLGDALPHSFDPNAILLVPGAPVFTAGSILLSGTRLRDPKMPTRMSWDPLGLHLSSDSSLGVTWGVAMKVQDSAPPSMGRYVAVWRHGTSGWRVVAYSLLGISPPANREWALLPRTVPDAPEDVHAQQFLEADRDFAEAAADGKTAPAFRKWAAADAIMFGRRGFMITGPDMIGEAVDGTARWIWGPVAGGASGNGDLGWTVGEAVISSDQAAPIRTKYLSVWRTSPGGSPRFILDAGSTRP